MTASLQVRLYNVRFGDAILVSVPDRDEAGEETVRHLLIDVGNALSTTGGDDAVFQPVFEDILAVLDGRPVDVYVMTHEHLDHVQGLKFAADRLGLAPPIRRVWLTGSAHPEYYENHPEAKKRRLEAVQTYLRIRRFLAAAPQRSNGLLDTMLLNNDVLALGDPGLAGGDRLAAAGSPSRTADCVEHLRTVGQEPPLYVHRELDLATAQPFREATLRVLAPEEDTSDYYGRFQPMALGDAVESEGAGVSAVQEPGPPAGVDAGAFYDLVDSRRRGFVDNLLRIDAANNNTSVVLLVEWKGWKLLFPGDAEVRSWKTMHKLGLLEPVHFLKVGHHGSHNGTPPDELLDMVLPATRPDDRARRAAVSTFPGSYDNVPHGDTLDRIRVRVDELLDTEDVPDGQPVVVDFPAP